MLSLSSGTETGLGVPHVIYFFAPPWEVVLTPFYRWED